MKTQIELFDQPFFKPNRKKELKASGTISGSFDLIGTFKGFVIASSRSNQSTFLIKLYRQAIFTKPANKYSLLNQILRAFDRLSNKERQIIMDGYNSDGSVNKNLN